MSSHSNEQNTKENKFTCQYQPQFKISPLKNKYGKILTTTHWYPALSFNYIEIGVLSTNVTSSTIIRD